jgi:hypothetical protein
MQGTWGTGLCVVIRLRANRELTGIQENHSHGDAGRPADQTPRIVKHCLDHHLRLADRTLMGSTAGVTAKTAAGCADRSYASCPYGLMTNYASPNPPKANRWALDSRRCPIDWVIARQRLGLVMRTHACAPTSRPSTLALRYRYRCLVASRIHRPDLILFLDDGGCGGPAPFT